MEFNRYVIYKTDEKVMCVSQHLNVMVTSAYAPYKCRSVWGNTNVMLVLEVEL